jgi:HSP20 family protein
MLSAGQSQWIRVIFIMHFSYLAQRIRGNHELPLLSKAIFMKTGIPYLKEYCAYPGEYVPMPATRELQEKFSLAARVPDTKPLVNMDEYNDCFRIDVEVPGVKREEIFIHIQNPVLYITVLHHACVRPGGTVQLHEFENKCFERQIVLPENADTDFIAAEYRQGILSIYIPKTTEPSTIQNTSEVVVY